MPYANGVFGSRRKPIARWIARRRSAYRVQLGNRNAKPGTVAAAKHSRPFAPVRVRSRYNQTKQRAWAWGQNRDVGRA